MESLWCLIGAAVVCLLLAITALIARPPSLASIRPGQALRGCIALLLLLLAVALVGMAFVLVP